MKSSKSIRQQYGNSERSKSGKRSDKLYKLDRKSSRGMIYENEELRLRTININAEVERGQTDIKSLRKENEKLRREIWTLRDECDRLNKKVKAKFIEHEQGVYSVRCSGGNGGCSTQCNEGVGGCGCDTVHCKYNSEDSDSCGSCCCHEEVETPCTEECCNETKKLPDTSEQQQISSELQNDNGKITTPDGPATGPSILTNYDHLSVVSEETLSNSEVVLAQQQSENLMGYASDVSASQTTLPSLVRPLTPLTPIELVANEINDLQAVVPPLSYFENILSQHVNSNYGSTPESSSTTHSGKTIVKHTNGWDYKLESPFAQRRYQVNSVSPVLTKRSPAQTLTTFVPTTTVTPPCADNATNNEKPTLSKKPTDLSIINQYKPMIETVPITTVAPNGCVSTTYSALNTSNDNNDNNDGNTTPKHFFAPIKPKLKLNTALANQKRLPPPPIPVVASSSLSSQSNNNSALVTQSKCEPPDIYVTNGLATPYKPPNKPTIQPPPIPQRTTTLTTIQAQVSSTTRQHLRNRQQPQHCRQHFQMHHYQHQQHNNVAVTNNDVYNTTKYMAIISTTTTATTTTTTTENTNTLCTSMLPTNIETFQTTTTTVLTSNTLCNSLNPLLISLTSESSTTITTTTTTNLTLTSSSTMAGEFLTSSPCPSPACFKFINSNINFRKPNDPVYAIAQNVCHNLIPAPAVTQPLMSSIVKCCIAKQQQLQQLITAPPSSSILHSNNIVSIQPPPSAILTSISCNLTINSPFLTIPITTIPLSLTTSTTSTSCIVVDSMCQTDSANLESILNDIEAISEDILAIQLVKNKKSTESFQVATNTALPQNTKNTKPYRSEMNLLLTYDGDNPTIKEAVTTNGENNLDTGSNSNIARRARSLERDHTDSPSPHIPDPMQPFPENRKYIGFENVNKAAVLATASNVAATATQTSPVLNSPLNQRSQLPLSPLVTNVSSTKSPNGKSLPPAPPQRVYPPSLNIKCAGIARSTSLSGAVTSTSTQPTANSPILSNVPPNKSQLYAALANAAAKRAQFRSQPTHLTKSLDTEDIPEHVINNDGNKGDKEAIENAKRKARRVSIVCADTDSPETPDKPPPGIRSQSAALTTQTSTSGSCTDLQTILQNPSLRNLRQASQSTPNSPHSLRKYEGSPLGAPNVPPVISITPSSTNQHNRNSSHANGFQQQQSHYHGHSNSYPNVVSPLSQQHPQPRKNSQDTIKASAAEIACAAANVMRSKCSRRHSDGTVSHTIQRISSASVGTNGTHHHTHHHHRQHSSSVVSTTNPHHSHHSHQDSNHETVASYSDRNSNSSASSRESSASFSLRSQRRKLSVSSHTGGKIPWCGCWGNGCL